MRYHTKDIGQRAVDIADREAEKIWQATGNYDLWFATWMDTYFSVLQEFNAI